MRALLQRLATLAGTLIVPALAVALPPATALAE
jgi:hypothetical protein